MKIVVCIKQVPDAESVKTDPETGRLIREGVAATLNPFDMFALEEALRLKERFGGSVTILSMGPKNALHSIKFALAMGADEGVLLSDRAFAGADTLATSYTISRGIEKIGEYDLILCGIKTTDGDTGQVGANLAELLDIPNIYYLKRIRKIEGNELVLERLLEDRIQLLSASFPCLITVLKGTNIPRLPTLKDKLEAKQKPIKTYSSKHLDIDASKIGMEGSPTRVVKVFPPDKRKKGVILKGDPNKSTQELIKFLELKQLVNGE
jgi:electron transfer flavoprotein alpha/beta subunit